MSEDKAKDVSALTTCQECGKNDPNLLPIDSGLRLILTKAGRDSVPMAVCSSCLKNLKRSASHGAHELAKKELQADFTGQLWRSRTNIVKQGHFALQRGDYSDAAILYEKYLKILTMVVKVKDRKGLEPKQFNDHPKEITIISSVLWDLMLVYDANPKFVSKQMETAEILAKFVRFSPVYNAVIRKAEKEVRKSKNPQAFRHFLKLCDANTQRCFIANEAFGSRIDPTVISLCQFRDKVLKENKTGRKFVALYYRNSPQVACWLRKHPWLKAMIRPLLRGVAIVLRAIFRLPPGPLS